MNFAVFNAYENFLEKGDYPFFVLFLEIDPAKVDVNVHPSKLEVRFDEDKDIFNFTTAVVKKGLASFDLVPSLGFTANMHDDSQKLGFNDYSRSGRGDFSDRPAIGATAKPGLGVIPGGAAERGSFQNFREGGTERKKVSLNENDIDLIFGALSGKIERAPEGADIPNPFDDSTEPQATPLNRGKDAQYTPKIFETYNADMTETDSTPFIIQLHNKYILCQIKTGLMIIDQHVAHERILYELAKKQLTKGCRCINSCCFQKLLNLTPPAFC